MALAAATDATAAQLAAIAAAVEASPTSRGQQTFLGTIAGVTGAGSPVPEEEFERAAEALERQIGQLKDGSFPAAPDSPEALDRTITTTGIGEALDRTITTMGGTATTAMLRRSLGGPLAALARPASAPALRPASAQRSAKERRLILQQYRYVRKVEPDVPPIGQLLFDDSPSEAPPADQRLVLYNASSAALRRWSPEARAEGLAAAHDERDARHTEAARRRRLSLERRELELRRRAAYDDQRGPHASGSAAARRDLDTSMGLAGPAAGQWLLLYAASAFAGGRRRAAPASAAPAGCAQPALQIPGFAGLWLTLAAAAGFANQVQMEAEFKKVPERERLNCVLDSSRRGWARRVARSRLSTPMTVCVRQALDLEERMQSGAFVARHALMADMLSIRCQIRRRRRQAAKVVTCLSSWSTTGRIFARLVSIKRGMVRLQRWWRACRLRLHQTLDEVDKHFIRVEREQLKLELRAEEEFKSPGARRRIGEMTQLMQARAVQGKFRQLFLQHELRVRRYFHLPAIAVWEADFRKWRCDMRDLRGLRTPLASADGTPSEGGDDDGDGGDGGADKRRSFAFPPDQPSYVPSEDLEMREILLRARQAENEGDGGQWTQQLSSPTRRAGGASSGARPLWRSPTGAALPARGRFAAAALAASG